MLKLSHTTKKAALATLLAAGLAGSATVTLAPAAGHAQPYGYYDDDGYYHDPYYGGDWDNHYRADWYRDHPDWYRYHPDWDDHGWIGIGVPGFGIGIYDDYPHYYRHYCSDYDYDHGYCS
jgi:hypothetical protein